MRPTIRDIARSAGVSPATVSRVINDKAEGYMTDKTKQAVLRAIQQLDYTPDKRAQSLRGHTTDLIGVVIPGRWISYLELSQIIATLGYDHQVSVLTCSCEGDVKREQFYINFLQRQKVDGIIIISETLTAQNVNNLIRRDIPVVLLDEDIPGAEAPAVVTAYREGASNAVQYLIDLGHARIVFVKGYMGTPSSKKRLDGYLDALTKNNLRIDEALISQGDHTYKGGYKATKQLLKDRGDSFTAIFCSNDLMALGAIQCIHDMGKRVPLDYSVIGFDNLYYSSISVPPLTTVSQPYVKMVETAFDLIEKWGTKRKDTHVRYIPKLIIRDSCKDLRLG